VPERAPIASMPGTARTTARTVVALLALALAAGAGLWWGPGKGVGTDDTVRQLVLPTFTPAVSPWRERLAPPSPSAERRRFSLLGGTALLVLVLALVAPAYAESRRRSARGTASADRDVTARDEG